MKMVKQIKLFLFEISGDRTMGVGDRLKTFNDNVNAFCREVSPLLIHTRTENYSPDSFGAVYILVTVTYLAEVSK